MSNERGKEDIKMKRESRYFVKKTKIIATHILGFIAPFLNQSNSIDIRTVK